MALEAINVFDFDANKVDLRKEYAGKPLLVIIYNNQCLGCTGRAIPLAYEFKQAYKDLQVVGIHTNLGKLTYTGEDILSIFTSGELPFPIYLDDGHKVYDQFDSDGTPQWLLFASDGSLYKRVFGSQTGAQNRLGYALDELLHPVEQ